MKKKEAKYPIPIREWSEDDRPREKLLKYGEHTLRNVYPVEFRSADSLREIPQGEHIPLGFCNSNMKFFPKAPPAQC